MVFGGYLTLVVCTRGVGDGILLRETFHGRGLSERRRLRQPRAVVARVQPARARGGAGSERAPARAGEVPRHLQLEPGRVLHGAGGGAEAAHPGRATDGRDPTGSRPLETMRAVAGASPRAGGRAAPLLSRTRSSRCSPAKGSSCSAPKRSATSQQRFLEEYFRRTLLPVLTPLAVDPGHPFPYLGNRSLVPRRLHSHRRRLRRCP